MASDSTQIFCAIAVEAFLNFYGVVRLTESGYGHDIEKRGLRSKVQLILEHCDGVRIPEAHGILAIALRISNRRGRPSHPKSRELPAVPTPLDRAGDPIPQAAQDAYEDMLDFFRQFKRLVPDAAIHFPDEIQAALVIGT